MDDGIFHCKNLALPQASSFLKKEGTFGLVNTVHKRLLTSPANPDLQTWQVSYTVIGVELQVQGLSGVYNFIVSVSPAS